MHADSLKDSHGAVSAANATDVAVKKMAAGHHRFSIGARLNIRAYNARVELRRDAAHGA
jgi:hypothetical protein